MYDNRLLMTGNIINKHNFVYTLKSAIHKAFVKYTVSSGFKQTGIYPFDPTAPDFTDIPDYVDDTRDDMMNNGTDDTTTPCAPCNTCGATAPCRECVIRANILVKIGIVKDPVAATVLTLPVGSSDSKPKRVKNARLLTSDEIRDSLNVKKSSKKSKPVVITDNDSNDNQTDIDGHPSHDNQTDSHDNQTDFDVHPSHDNQTDFDGHQPSYENPPTGHNRDNNTSSQTKHNNTKVIKPSHVAAPTKDTSAEIPTCSRNGRPIRNTKRPNADIYYYDDNSLIKFQRTTTPVKRRVGKSKSKTDCGRKSKIDDDNDSDILTFCDDCGRKIQDDTALKCVKCSGHYHCSCLPRSQQIAADLNSVAGNAWLCEVCNSQTIAANSRLLCSVCVAPIDAWKVYEYVKCGKDSCNTFYHYQCLSEQTVRQITNCASMKQTWLCNSCVNEQ